MAAETKNKDLDKLFNQYQLTSQDLRRNDILRYNNENPESSAERVLLPKAQKTGRIRKPLSDDNNM